MKKYLLTFLFLATAVFGADIYFSQKAVVTTMNLSTNYFIILLGDGTNSLVRRISPLNVSNLIYQSFTSATNGFYKNQYTTNAYNSVGVPDSLWFDGAVGATPTSGAGTRLMWIPAKQALRAGAVTGTQWNAANIGTASASFGSDNIGSGQFCYVAGSNNKVDANNAIIGCGDQNTNSALYGVIAGGARNWIQTGSAESVISGGNVNTIEANVLTAVIAGGDTQTIRAGGDSGFIGGGIRNEINTNASESFIAGGEDNFVGRNASLSFILSGQDNKTATNDTVIIGEAITNKTKFSAEIGFYDTNKVRVDQTNLWLIGNEKLRQTNGAANGYVLTSTNGGDAIWLPGTQSGETNFNGEVSVTNATFMGLVYGKSNNTNLLRSLSAGANIVLTNNGTNIVIASTASGGSVTGTTNILNLSVQAAKPPSTNFPIIDAGNQDWELLYAKTNKEGSISGLTSTFQFVVPPDYATNSMKVRVLSTLNSTNGPNTSNTIFAASFLVARPGTTADVQTNAFGTEAFGTNTWTQSSTAQHQVQSIMVSMSTSSLLMAGDLAILRLRRDATNDTFGATTAVVGLQLEYLRP